MKIRHGRETPVTFGVRLVVTLRVDSSTTCSCQGTNRVSTKARTTTSSLNLSSVDIHRYQLPRCPGRPNSGVRGDLSAHRAHYPRKPWKTADSNMAYRFRVRFTCSTNHERLEESPSGIPTSSEPVSQRRRKLSAINTTSKHVYLRTGEASRLHPPVRTTEHSPHTKELATAPPPQTQKRVHSCQGPNPH